MMPQLALDRSEYDELWQQFVISGYYTDFFQDEDLRLELYELTAGHVSDLESAINNICTVVPCSPSKPHIP